MVSTTSSILSPKFPTKKRNDAIVSVSGTNRNKQIQMRAQTATVPTQHTRKSKQEIERHMYATRMSLIELLSYSQFSSLVSGFTLKKTPSSMQLRINWKKIMSMLRRWKKNLSWRGQMQTHPNGW